MSIDEVNEELGLDLAEGEFETVAGFVLDILGHIPSPGAQVEYGDLKVEVTERNDHKIEAVKLTRTLEPSQPPSS